MEHAISVAELGRVRKQRNIMGMVSIGLGFITVLAILAAVTQSREVILQPINRSPLEISSSGVTKDYLEFVTRDVAQLALNRSPENLNYWKESLLEIASPDKRGELSTALVAIVEEQSGSSISQSYSIASIKVDPEKLTSEVSGTLTTIAGSKVISTAHKKFRFHWSYQGLSLRLRGFGLIDPNEGIEE